MLKYKINFYLYKESLTKPGYFSIRAYISYAGKRPYVYTGIYVSKEEWNNQTQRVDGKDSIENYYISDVEKIIRDIFKDYDYHEERYPAPKELKEAFDNRYKKRIPEEDIEENAVNSSEFVYKRLDEFMSLVGDKDQWTDANYKRYTKIRNHFFMYKETLKLSELEEIDLVGFIKYFQNGPKDFKTGKRKEPHRNTTIIRTIKDVRSFLRWAYRQKYYFGDLHNTFKPKFKGTATGLSELVFFSWDELMKFYHYKFKPNQDRLEHVRDVIAFCCFSSLRFSDAFSLKKSYILKDYFVTTTKKTVDPLRIDLNDYTRAILEKYNDFDFPGGKALPVISMQKTNEYLKEIGQILGFNDPVTDVYFVGSKRFEETSPKWAALTTHIGRRTFIVNSLYLKIPETVIMKWTGHKNYQSMKPYIAVVDELKSSEMNKFNLKNREEN